MSSPCRALSSSTGTARASVEEPSQQNAQNGLKFGTRQGLSDAGMRTRAKRQVRIRTPFPGASHPIVHCTLVAVCRSHATDHGRSARNQRTHPFGIDRDVARKSKARFASKRSDSSTTSPHQGRIGQELPPPRRNRQQHSHHLANHVRGRFMTRNQQTLSCHQQQLCRNGLTRTRCRRQLTQQDRRLGFRFSSILRQQILQIPAALR